MIINYVTIIKKQLEKLILFLTIQKKNAANALAKGFL